MQYHILDETMQQKKDSEYQSLELCSTNTNSVINFNNYNNNILMAASPITQNPFALSLFSSIKSAFLINAITALNEVSNAMWLHMVMDTNLVVNTSSRGTWLGFTLLSSQKSRPWHVAMFTAEEF